MKEKLINIDPDIVSGTPVIIGTRVPVKSLFDYLEGGYSLDDFLRNFPGVEREKAMKILEMAGKLITSDRKYFNYENTF